MESFIASGGIAEAIAALVAVEFVLLLILRSRVGRGPPVAGIAAMLGAGLCLVMALRASLAGAGPSVVGGWLAVALVAHAIDVLVRFRR